MTTIPNNPAAIPVENSTRYVETLVRERIRSGEYAAGERLPTLRTLADELHIDKTIIRTAIQTLEQEGLIVRPPNCRATVRGFAGMSDHDHYWRRSEAGRKLSRFMALIMRRGLPREDGGSGQERIFLGLNQMLQRSGYHTIFLDLEDSERLEGEPTDVIAAYLQYALDQGFGGIVCYGDYGMDRDTLRRVAAEVPLVLIDRKLPGIDADFVGVTNYRGTYEAVKYLVELGHKRIAYVTRMDPVTAVWDRMMGYRGALRDSFEPGFFEMVVSEPSEGMDPWPAFDAMLAMPLEKRPTALVCVNDYQAAAVAERLVDAGLHIPGDMSLMGFDNLVPKVAGGIELTSVAQPLEEIGEVAAKLLMRRMSDSKARTEEVECSTRLIIRETCRSIAT